MRALRILKEVSLIAAEDTRKTQRLLVRYDIHTPLTSYFEHNKLSKLETHLAALERGDVALVSEAGMPGISDPGYELVRAAVERGVTVTPLPGPSAPIAALAAAGLPTDRFLYLGFLPRQAAERRRLLSDLAGFPHTLVAFESPHRLLKTLQDMVQSLGGQRRMAVCRELTKLHEEILRGAVAEMAAHFAQVAPRGEFTLVIEGKGSGGADLQSAPGRLKPAPHILILKDRLRDLLASGLSNSEAVRQVVQETGRPRREVYRAALSL